MNRFDIMLKKTPPPPPPPSYITAVIDDGKVNRNGRIYSYSPSAAYAGVAVYVGDDNRPIGIVTNIQASPHISGVAADSQISQNIGSWGHFVGGGGSSGNFSMSVGGGGNSGDLGLSITTKGSIGL
jgi:hypothetical protein